MDAVVGRRRRIFFFVHSIFIHIFFVWHCLLSCDDSQNIRIRYVFVYAGNMCGHKIITSKNRYKDKVKLISRFFIAMENRPRQLASCVFVCFGKHLTYSRSKTNLHVEWMKTRINGNMDVGNSSVQPFRVFVFVCTLRHVVCV